MFIRILLLLLATGLFAGCKGPRSKDFAAELRQLVDSTNDRYRIDSIRIDVYKDSQTVSLPVSFKKLEVSSEPVFVQVPLLASSKAVSRIRASIEGSAPPATEVLKIQSRTGLYFYVLLLDLDSSQLAHLATCDGQLNIKYTTSLNDDQKFTLVPLTGTPGKRETIITTQKQGIAEMPDYHFLSGDNIDGGFIQLPETLTTARSVYSSTVQNFTTDVLRLPLSSDRSFGKNTRNIARYLLFLIGASCIIFFYTRRITDKIDYRLKMIGSIPVPVVIKKPASKVWLYAILISLLLLLLAIVVNAQSPVAPKAYRQNMIENFQITLTPKIVNKKLTLLAVSNFVLTTTQPGKLQDTVVMNITTSKNAFDDELKFGSPDDVKIDDWKKEHYHQLSIRANIKKKMNAERYRYLTTRKLPMGALDSLMKSNEAITRIRTRFGFKEFEIKEPNYVKIKNLSIHPFPFDNTSLTIPLEFEQFTSVSNIIIEKSLQFDANVTSNIESIEFDENEEQYLLRKGKGAFLRPGERMDIKMELKRNWMVTFAFPVFITALLIVWMKFYDYKGIEAVIGLALTAGYAGFDRFMATNVPSMADMSGKINLYDIFFIVLLAVVIIIGFCRKYAKSRKG